MSTITYDRTRHETKTKVEKPAIRQLETADIVSREDEFRSALASYLADYRKHQMLVAKKRRGAGHKKFSFFAKLTKWVHI